MSRLLWFCVAAMLVTGCVKGPPAPAYIVGKPSDKPCNWSVEVDDGIYYLALIRLSDDSMISQGPYAARIKVAALIQEAGETMAHEKELTLYASPTDGRIPVTGLSNVKGLRALSCEAFYT
jgi:hypothetical protein